MVGGGRRGEVHDKKKGREENIKSLETSLTGKTSRVLAYVDGLCRNLVSGWTTLHTALLELSNPLPDQFL